MTLARRLPQADAYTVDVTLKVRTETRELRITNESMVPLPFYNHVF